MRIFHTVFLGGCANENFNQQYTRLTFSPQPPQPLSFHVFLIIAILTVWGTVSLWVWFPYPVQVMMFSICSHTCWPSVYLLWKIIFSDLAHFLVWLFDFFCCWVVKIPNFGYYGQISVFSESFWSPSLHHFHHSGQHEGLLTPPSRETYPASLLYNSFALQGSGLFRGPFVSLSYGIPHFFPGWARLVFRDTISL